MAEIVESSLVVPSKETPTHTIWLSNLDLVQARSYSLVHTPTVYFYSPNEEPDFFSVERLKEALRNVLVPYYPLAGRLGVNRNGRLEINCTGEGVLFVVARSGMTLTDDVGDYEPSEAMRNMLVPSVDSADSPHILAMFQVTFFRCGGVCLGTAIHHTAADGRASIFFINAWAELARRRTTEIAVTPSVDRTLLCSRSPPMVLFDHIEYSPKPSSDSPTTNPDLFLTATLKLNKPQIERLKKKSTKPMSTFKVILAHIWRTACKARLLEPNQETRLMMTADARARIQPQLPSSYLGNAVFRKSVVATTGEIMSNGLEFGADKIGEAIDQLGDKFVRSLIDYLEVPEDDKVAKQKGKRAMLKNDLWVLSWLGLPIYDTDFGWGKPAFMRKAYLQHNALIYIMRDAGESGDIIVIASLERENMERFKHVFYEEVVAC